MHFLTRHYNTARLFVFLQWESIDSAAESLSHEFSAALVDFFKADGDRMCLPICHLLFPLPTIDHGQLL